MSDESRSVHTRAGRQQRPRILVVSNPTESSDEDTRARSYPQPAATNYRARPLPSPSRSAPLDRPQTFSGSHVPPPLRTNLPEQRPCYPSSRSNPSNPALSSPSSTSSPAFESTPPPSTPGQSAPPVDFIDDGTARPEASIAASDRAESTPHASSQNKLFDRFKCLPKPGHSRRSSNNGRPPSSPSTSTPEPCTTQPSHDARTSPYDKVVIMVTADADNFSTVDVTGALTPAFIRERIFTKLQISDEDQPKFSIYRTEIGTYAIGEALTDDELFNLYSESGDSKGTLKLFVSHSSAPVHEPSQDVALVSPTVNTIPPPVLPQHSLYAPLRPKKHNRSRHGSQSSVSERPAPEAEYDASVSDDLDHPESRRSTIRPLPQHVGHVHHPSSPGRHHRPRSPVPVQPPSQTLTYDYGNIHHDTYGGPTPTFIPGTSPSAPRFHDEMRTSPSSARDTLTGSSATTYPDRPPQSPEMQPSPNDKHSRSASAREDKDAHDRERKRRDTGLRREHGLRRRPPTDSSESPRTMTPGDYVLVEAPSSGPTSTSKKDRSGAPQDTKSPSSRYAGSTAGYGINLPLQPRAPLPPPPSSNESRSKRQAGKQVPINWAIAWKPPTASGKDERSRVLVGAKSMTDMRGAFKAPVPTSLQPGRSSRPGQSPQLPLTSRPSTSGSTTSVSGTAPASNREVSFSPHHEPSNSDSLMGSRTYDISHKPGALSPTYPSRPGPMSGHSLPPPNGVPQLSMASSTSQDSYPPRPHSSLDDTATSPLRPHRGLPPSRAGGIGVEGTISRAPYAYGLPGTSPQSTASRPDGLQSTTLSADGLRLGYPRQEYTHDPSAPLYDVVSLARQPRTPPRSPIRAQGERSEKEVEIRGLRPSASRQLLRETSDSDKPEEPLRDTHPYRDDSATWFPGFIDENAAESTARPRARNNTAVPLYPPLSAPSEVRSVSNSSHGSSLGGSVRGYANEDDYEGSGSEDGESDDDGDGTLFARAPKIDSNGLAPWQNFISEPPRSGTRPTLAPLSIENSPSSTPTALPQNGHSETSRGIPDGFPAVPNYIPTPPAHWLPKRSQPSAEGQRRGRDQRTSRFDDNYDCSWAPRPPPEDVFERLEEYFPEHDLDRPVIDAPSGGTSPTSSEAAAPLPARRHKKSIRHVALEHNRRRDGGPVSAALRKRNTKLWGSRLEEVTTQQAASGAPSATSDQSPGGGAKPIFRWVRGELIGKGTYGKVYLALNATTGEMIAVKQVEIPRTASDKSDSRQVSVVEALKLESETLKDLDHPHIVQYLGFEETPTFLSIFLEYVPGGSIASCLRKHGRFDEEVTKSFTGQILEGLEYLHSKGILHRDLKADNILVETSGICKISDFGISKRTEDINVIGAYTSMQGTVFWMAPEVINSQKKGYNSKIDIWSVGCVVFEMWTGQRPWSGQEAMAVLLHLYNTKQAPPVPNEVTLSPLAHDFRQQCFAMDPDERPTAAELRQHRYLELQPGWSFNGFK